MERCALVHRLESALRNAFALRVPVAGCGSRIAAEVRDEGAAVGEGLKQTFLKMAAAGGKAETTLGSAA